MSDNSAIFDSLKEINAKLSDMVEKHGGRFCMMVGVGTPIGNGRIKDSWTFHHSKNWERAAIIDGLEICKEHVSDIE